MYQVLSLAPPAGCRVLVTGGARGIGRATAEAFAAHGARIGVLDAAAVPDAPADWLVRQGQVEDGAAVEAAFAAMDMAHGGVDVAFANAGIAQRRPSLDLPETEWRRIVDINLTGVFLTAQAAARRMVAAGGGLILVTGSIYSLVGAAERAGYAATKAAVANLVRSLACEWAPHGVRVNALAPAYIDTELLGGLDHARLRARTPLGRLGRAEEVAGAACFLASPAAGYITGTVLSVDGGYIADGSP